MTVDRTHQPRGDEMNHTLGPFIVRHDYNEDTTFITESHGIDLAQVFRLPEYENNSALFAAAPVMLEALKHCHAVFSSMADRGRYPDELIPTAPHYLGKQGFEFLVNAIAKAEGKETL